MYKLIIKTFAELDAIDAANWYNDKREGLGEEFVLALDAKINAIQRNPTHFQVVYRNIRRALTERFPYGIFFIVEDEIIYVLAIQHTSRNPKIWEKRK
ncbi:MAG: type II toxin-antitoxin system RelE/ParE family toxin [Prolixibacteraceae bacterium]|jgi:plasmid stabilization system protein ParE|nr:type II toxin-antitoxin system RelE/ParE family toxin [Prolixibacteraceae bacterium]MBN2649677.1 type II toxin-antitoxin system RelE/ParE family toxin [Prolixibacteraceae bacterium]